MKSGDGVAMLDERIAIKKCDVEELVLNSSKCYENKNICDGEESIGKNEASKLAENPEGSEVATEVSLTDSSEISTPKKATSKFDGAMPKKDKVGKGKSSVQGSTPPFADAFNSIDRQPNRNYVKRALANSKFDFLVPNDSAKPFSQSKPNSQHPLK